MRRTMTCGTMLAVACLLSAAAEAPDKVLFEDNFDTGLSAEWDRSRLKPEDYRIRDGALELRVQPGPLTKETPRLQIMLPFLVSQTTVVSVEVTPVDTFTEPEEFGAVYLIDESGVEFGARKQWITRRLMFSPGRDIFRGAPGEEGDPDQYDVVYTPAREQAGPLRIIVDRGYGYFQVGPSAEGKYLNFFHSALRKNSAERGFCLVAAGGPAEGEHWVRFENFRVFRR